MFLLWAKIIKCAQLNYINFIACTEIIKTLVKFMMETPYERVILSTNAQKKNV